MKTMPEKSIIEKDWTVDSPIDIQELLVTLDSGLLDELDPNEAPHELRVTVERR